ncbi:tapemeasure protein [Mycobacterium phage Naca]|uniref:Tapemeasure protein n=1 Tax=Mycobacterium phage Naca TaxID=2126816 RepID=A0A2P1N230_9CAUD|nr:tapemeasure protein [Mycobacterium phage Naca]AVP42060.1 tapemeasure protein [Mycobacterium phage Naca]
MAKGSAGGKGGTEVGRIYIRVVPDADGFHGNLRRQLQGADEDIEIKAKPTGLDKVRRQAQEATRGLEAEVDVKANTATAVRQLDLFQKRQLKDLQKHFANLETKIPLTPEGERMRRMAERAVQDLEKDIKADIPIEASLAAGQRAKVLEEVEAVKRLAERDAIQLKLDPKFDYKLHNRLSDMAKRAAEAELKAEQDYNKRLKSYHDQLYEDKHKTRITDWRRELQLMKERDAETRKFAENYRREMEAQKALRIAPDSEFRKTMLSDLKKAAKDLDAAIPFTVDGEKLRRNLRAEVEAIEREIDAEVPVDLNLAAAQRMKIKAAIESIRARVPVEIEPKVSKGNLAKKFLGNVMPSFGSGINFGGYALIFAGILDFLAPVVGLISTAFLTLPGLIASIATPIGVVALGIDGIAKAAETLKEPFESLKKTVSDTFQTRMTPIFEQLKPLFPMFESALPTVAHGLSDMAQGLADLVTKGNGAQVIENTIRNIGNAISAATPGMQSFVGGLLGLAEQLSLKFPSIVKWFNDAGDRFLNWVQVASADGTLSSAFDGLGQSLKFILDTVTDLGKQGLDFMKNPENLEMFKQQLEGIGNILKQIMEWSAGLNENFEALKQFGRVFMVGADLLQGDLKGAWSNGKDFVTNLFGDTEQPALEAGQRTGVAFTEGMSQVLQPGENNVATSLEELMTGGAGMPNTPPPAMQIPPPNLEPAKQEVTQYQSFIDSVTQQVRGALSQATSGDTLPAPNFEAFKAAWTGLHTFISEQVAQFKVQGQLVGDSLGSGMSGFVNKAKSALTGLPAATQPSFDAMKQQAISAFGQIETAAAELPGKIGAQLGGLAGIGHSAGLQLMSGLTAGMQAGEGAMLGYVRTIAGKIAENKGPLPYDKRVLIPNGEALMDGLGVGLATGFEDVLARAKSMAEQISEAIEDGISLDSILGGTKLPELQKMLDTLEEQRKVLKVQKNNTTDKSQRQILTDQMSQLQAQKDQLSLIKDQYLNTNKYGTEVQSVTEMWDQMFQKMFDMPFNFAKATGGQLLSDLGIGGGGALTTLAEGLIDWGINAGKKFIFNVNSMDEALSAQRNLVNREALQFTR